MVSAKHRQAAVAKSNYQKPSANATPNPLETIANPLVLKSFEEAGRLVDEVLSFALSRMVDGANIFKLCCEVDEEMNRVCGAVAKAGSAFPCAISPNSIICHFSPTRNDEEARLLCLKTGDLAKIEFGLHVENCPAFICHSMIVGGVQSEVGGEANDTMAAAWTAACATAKHLRPGRRLVEMTDQLANIPTDFGVNYTQGLMTHVIARNNLAGDKGLVYRPTVDQRRLAQEENAQVEANELYLIDVVVSSGKYAVARPVSFRTSIYKKSGNGHSLKLKTSRQFLKDVGDRYGSMAFSLRDFADTEGRCRVAIKECLASDLVHSYDVIADFEETARTARFAFLVAVLPDENRILTHPPVQAGVTFKTEKQASESTRNLL